MDRIQRDIQEYLTRPNDLGTSLRVVEHGEAAFEAILHYSGPYPVGMHPVDGWCDDLIPLLGKIGALWPELLRKHLTTPDSDTILSIIGAAVSTRDPQFAAPLVRLLDSRSYYAIDSVLDAMQKHEYLRTPSAVPYLEKLLAGKKINRLTHQRKEIETLLVGIQHAQNPDRPLDPIREPCPCGAGSFVRNRRYDDGGGVPRDAGIVEKWSMECPACAGTYVETVQKGFEPDHRRWVRTQDLRRYTRLCDEHTEQLEKLVVLARSTYLSTWRHFFEGDTDFEVWQKLFRSGLLDRIAHGRRYRHTGLAAWPAFSKCIRLSGRPTLLADLFVDEQFETIFRLMGVKDQKLEFAMTKERELLRSSLEAFEEMKRNSHSPRIGASAEDEQEWSPTVEEIPFTPGVAFTDGPHGWMELGIPPGALQVPSAGASLSDTAAKGQNLYRIPAWAWKQLAFVNSPRTVAVWRDNKLKLAGIFQGGEALYWKHNTDTEGCVLWWASGTRSPGHVCLEVRRRDSDRTRLILLGTPQYEPEAVAWLREKADLLRQVFPSGIRFEDQKDEAEADELHATVVAQCRDAACPPKRYALRECDGQSVKADGVPSAGTAPETAGRQAGGESPMPDAPRAARLPRVIRAFSLLTIVLLALGIAALRGAYRDYAEGRRFDRTPPVTGKILTFRHVTGYAKRSRSPKSSIWLAKPVQVPVVTYEYWVNGKRYTGSQISRNHDDYYLSTFPVFQNPKVFYDPEHPDNAYLDSTVDFANAQIMACLGLALVGWACVRMVKTIVAKPRPVP